MVQSLPTQFYSLPIRTGKVGFKKDSSTHALLCLTQVMSGLGDPGCSVEEALKVLCGKFSSGTKVWRSVEVLIKNKYIQLGVMEQGRPCSNNSWLITNKGREALMIANRDTVKG